MYKIINCCLVLSIVLSLFSCKKDNVIIDKDPPIPSTYTRFVQVTNSGVLIKKVPVKSSNNTGLVVDLGITNLSTIDRTIELEYTSNTAVNGVNFTAPTMVTFKAGQSIATLNVKGDYNFYSTDQIDTVKVKIKSTSSIPAMIGRDSIFLIFQEYCDVLNVVDYNQEYGASYTVGPNGIGSVVDPPGGYPVLIDSLGMLKTTATSAVGTIDGMHAISSDGPIYFTMDWDDPSNPSIVINQQYYYTNASGALRYIKTSSSKASTFNACKKTFDIFIDVYTPATSTTQEVIVESGRWIHVEF